MILIIVLLAYAIGSGIIGVELFPGAHAEAPQVAMKMPEQTFSNWLWWQILWWCPVVFIALAGACGCWWMAGHARNKWRLIYPDNGILPVVQMNTASFTERARGVKQTTFVPPAMLGQEAATVRVHKGETQITGGRSDWTSQHQLSIAHNEQKTRLAVAMRSGSGKMTATDYKAANGRYDAPQTPIKIVEPEIIPPSRQLPMWSAKDALKHNTSTTFALGLTVDNEIVSWDVEGTPHVRVHGKTQGSGKTNLIKEIAVGAIRSGAHVIVLDRRGFKDWSAFSPFVELVDNRIPGAFYGTVKQIKAIYEERDGMLGSAGVGNLASLKNAPPRLFVIISEFGSACRAAADSGELDMVVPALKSIMSEAGATGVHMVFEDQAINRNWPPELRGNAEPITGYLPEDASKAGGYRLAFELERYQFHYDGDRFKTFDMSAEASALLFDCQTLPESEYVIDVRSFGSFDTDKFSAENAMKNNSTANERTERTYEPTDRQRALKEWRAANPGNERGIQARAIRELQAQGIDISKAYVCEMWDNCQPSAVPTPSQQMPSPTIQDLIAQYGEVHIGSERVTTAVDKTQEVKYR